MPCQEPTWTQPPESEGGSRCACLQPAGLPSRRGFIVNKMVSCSIRPQLYFGGFSMCRSWGHVGTIKGTQRKQEAGPSPLGTSHLIQGTEYLESNVELTQEMGLKVGVVYWGLGMGGNECLWMVGRNCRCTHNSCSPLNICLGYLPAFFESHEQIFPFLHLISIY